MYIKKKNRCVYTICIHTYNVAQCLYESPSQYMFLQINFFETFFNVDIIEKNLNYVLIKKNILLLLNDVVIFKIFHFFI